MAPPTKLPTKNGHGDCQSSFLLFSPIIVSEVPWYAWVVVSIKILLVLALIAFGIYKLIVCLLNRKKKTCCLCQEDNIPVPEVWEKHRRSCLVKYHFNHEAMEEHLVAKCPKCERLLRNVVG